MCDRSCHSGLNVWEVINFECQLFLGFSTPGPYLFRPESERGPNHVLGMQLKKDNSETLGPGEREDCMIWLYSTFHA